MRNHSELQALILAGGRGTRLGADKATVEYCGRSQLERIVGVCTAAGLAVTTAIRSDQRYTRPFRLVETIEDQPGVEGPMAGLVAAWNRYPTVAWLVVAVDMPLVNLGVIQQLLGARNVGLAATAFVHPDGTIDPLCTIWEPRLRHDVIAQSLAGHWSLRRLLESAPVQRVVPADATRLVSVNTPSEYAVACARLESDAP